MKLTQNNILYLLLMILTLAACETDDYQNQTTGGDSYLSLCIGLPDVARGTSRADTDGKLEMTDGLEDGSEYALYNAQLLIFEEDKNHQDDYKYSKLCYVTELPMNPKHGNGQKPHVSQRYTFDNLLLDGFEKDKDKKYYGLIVANYQGISFTDKIGNTFSELDGTPETLLSGYLIDKNNVSMKVGSDIYLLMTNTMLFDDHGETAATATEKPVPEILVDITDKLKYVPITEEADYAVFYIERVAAKVEVNIPSITGTLEGTEITYTITGWKLINELNDTYLIRHWDKNWPGYKSLGADADHKYRFLSSLDIENGTVNDFVKYRGYFSACPAYCIGDRFCLNGRVTSKAEHETSTSSHRAYDYCVENTMKAEHMMMMNSTHVLVEVQFSDKDVPEYYLIPIKHFGNDYTPWRDGEDKNDPVLPIDYSPNHNRSWAQEDQAVPEHRQLAIDNMNKSYPNNYGTRNANYLGRWGVVRNNWYVITINGIKGRGLTKDPSETPDDGDYNLLFDPTPLDYYENNLKCTMTVKNWIVRDQSAVLQ